ncbi:stage V sporulation protein AA [Lentibacillus sp. N15]|uniref:stage V sporulation protein AA n=1 Tax=Lentibacillus songyuanensis TaxID=3136161 RepID=UPI0031BB58A1
MTDIVYIRMKKKLEKTKAKTILLKEIAYLSTSSEHKQEMEETSLYRITEKDRNIVIIDGFIIIDHLRKSFPDIEFQLVGPAQTIIWIVKKKKKPSVLLASFVWLILFVGTAMTIMNFHYDVSMQEVQQKLHYLLTGKHSEYPLWIQVPYSFGLGVGMLLFFNHWFKKRFNEEPSPLEIELFNYQQDLHQYVMHYENKLND